MYYQMFKKSVKKQLVYNWEVLFSCIISLFSMFMLACFWKAIYAHDIVNYKKMLQYAVIAQLLGNMYYISAGDRLCGFIRDGSLSVELLKPCNVVVRLFAENFGEIAVKIIISSIPTFILASIVFRLKMIGPLNFVLFLIAIILSMVLLFLVKVCISTICFWIIEAGSFLILINTVILLFSGQFMPSWLMPQFLKNIMEHLPFIWMYQKPIELYQMNASNTDILLYFLKIVLMQGSWILLFTVLLHFIWKIAIKKVVVQGG